LNYQSVAFAQGFNVTHSQSLNRTHAEAYSAAPELPRKNEDDICTHLLDELKLLLTSALPNCQHRNDCSNADEDAEGRQDGTEFIRHQAVPCNLKHFPKH
jgi:hypothetical protein